MHSRIYAPVGSCIYCGASNWSQEKPRKLGDEHIVPEGLGGELVLPESSCKSCETETSRVELEWLRSSFAAARAQKALEKKKKRAPRHLPLRVRSKGQSVLKTIPIEEYPAQIVTLLFDQPEILLDVQPVEKELSGGIAIGILPSFGRHLKRYLDQGAVTFPPIRNSATSQHLGRMLAKIAHSYAVAELGVNGFQPFLQPIILGTDVRHLAHYVGGTREIPPAIEDVYKIELKPVESKGGGHYLMAIIRLLSDIQGMPEYRVVVGQPAYQASSD
jgi:hypothetical protein